MKFIFTLLAVFASFILAMHAQTVVKENVVKIPSTNALTESIVIPSGLSLTINSGATITNNGTATGFGSGGTWGSITGTLSAQADLQSALDQKLSLSSAASNYAPIANPTFTGLVTVPGANGLVINSGGSTAQIDFYGSGLSRTYLKAGTFSGVKIVTLPATTGTLITTGDTGTVTSSMLAGSIDPSKITGTAATLGANTFTAGQTINSGNLSLTGTDPSVSLSTGVIQSTSADTLAFTVNGSTRMTIFGSLGFIMTGTDYHDSYTGSQFSSSGSARDVQFRATATGIWEQIKSGTQQTYRVYDSGATKYLQVTHDGTNAEVSASSGAVAIKAGGSTRVTVSAAGEVFLNLPASAGTTGSLWNDGGTVKVAP